MNSGASGDGDGGGGARPAAEEANQYCLLGGCCSDFCLVNKWRHLADVAVAVVEKGFQETEWRICAEVDAGAVVLDPKAKTSSCPFVVKKKMTRQRGKAHGTILRNLLGDLSPPWFVVLVAVGHLRGTLELGWTSC